MEQKDFLSSLHLVQKPPAKPWRKTDNVPAAPRVYRVEPRGFRDLVQKLTGKPPRQLKESVVPPPPLALESTPQMNKQLFTEDKIGTSDGVRSPTAGLVSPSFYSAWCSFPLLSPAWMAGLDNTSEAVP
ncbi:WAS/WASL-interacting protein family member 1-like protein [Carex littledalei]|uniref:WAS/WASL-interacting protein family member 1-like protein n=1 Tax=Carex littledalei TaxID=544730 RepID=A0A833RCW9_9POAL|nr:WAS/WASL-interacting protein family member 1-like protein [Carex littledalei]